MRRSAPRCAPGIESLRVAGLAGWLVLALGSIAACDAPPPRPRGDAGLDAPAVLDAPGGADAGALDAGTTEPDPRCVVADVAGDLSVEPPAPLPGVPLTVRASDPSPLTNVELEVCTPAGAVAGTFADVTGAYTWRFDVAGLPRGASQVIFRSDPGRTVRATMRVVVAGEPTDAGAGLDAGARPDAPPSGACGPLSGSLVDGTFESGLSGMAPAGWQVRDPAFAAGCPAGVLAIVPGDPACGGSALAIDAMGSWDCYAIQRFTDYATITGGRAYRVHARVRSERQDNPAAWFVLGVQWLDGADVVFGDEKNPRLADVNYDWSVLEWDLVAPANARRAVVWLSAHFPGRVTYDDVSIAAAP